MATNTHRSVEAGANSGRTGYGGEDATGFGDKVQILIENLGAALTAHMLGKSPSTVNRWAQGSKKPAALADEQRIEATFQVFQFLIRGEGTSRSNHAVRAWFIGMNPQLDDKSPAEIVAAGEYRRVMAAARAYTAGG